MRKILDLLPWVIVGGLWIIIVVTAYWLLYPYKPIVFNNLPMKIDQKIVKTGDFLTYNVDYCKYSTLIPTASKTFVDQIIYNIPAEVVVAKPLGCKVIKIQTLIPVNLPSGTYTLKITYRYQVNPIRTIDILVETEPFSVVK